MSSLLKLLPKKNLSKVETKCRIFTFRYESNRDRTANEISEILSAKDNELISLTQTQSNSDTDSFVTITLLYTKCSYEGEDSD